MITREFSEDEIREMDLDDIAHIPWRHGTRTTYVFEFGGAHWMFTGLVHHDEGLQLDGSVTCKQVRQVDIVVKHWEPVP